ncbi:MAG TPA: hypothetical protein DDW85_05995 [Porphyromonadaceae bacterium]|nr:hypothetical protein [Porphyromonadaceae bacterium]
MEKVIDRLIKFQQAVSKEHGGRNKFETMIGISEGYLSKMIKKDNPSVGSDIIEKVLNKFPLLNIDWLFTGRGDMIKPDNSLKTFIPDKLPKQLGRLYLAPIYNSLPVSAGKMELSTFEDEAPNGYAYTYMPNVKFFPVIGISFEPIIPAGYYIGVTRIDNINEWKRIDPEKIYLIITRDDRMMKRLRVDEENNDKLWCVSPNYPDFDIYKNDILEIYHVFFYGKMI